jgi:hypothetical protein
MPPGYVGPSKELDDICTERGVAFDENFSFRRRGRLSQLREDAWREVLDVVRNSLRRLERRSCGIDMRPEDFAAFDASAWRECVARIGPCVHDCSEAGMGKHLLQLLIQLRSGEMGSVIPFRFSEVNVRVPEPRKDDAAFARERRGARCDDKVPA